MADTSQCTEPYCAASLQQLAEEVRSAAGEAGEPIPAEKLLQWAEKLEQLANAATSESSSSSSSSDDMPAGLADSRATAVPRAEEVASFPVVPDNGKLRVRQVAPKKPISEKALSSLGLCLFTILQSIVVRLESETLTLYLPYRGSDRDFRMICTLSGNCKQVREGSTILRGTNSMEYACMSTGYIINIAPKTAFALREKSSSGSRRGAEDTAGTAPRLCCPLKTHTQAPPTGVLSVVGKRTIPFNSEEENYLFDVASTVADLLRRCDDVAALQKCFAKDDFHTALPMPHIPAITIPSVEMQMVYRANEQSPHLAATVRVAGENGVVHLREGAPILTVFQHMEQMQKAWSSAVKLNVELKGMCDSKDIQLGNAFTQLAEAERRGRANNSSLMA